MCENDLDQLPFRDYIDLKNVIIRQNCRKI